MTTKVNNQKKLSGFDVFKRGLIRENPVFRLVLGMCSSLAVSSTLIGSFSMGIAVLFVLMMSNILISLLRNVIADSIRIPAYITIIAGFVSIVQMLLQAFLPTIYDLLGIYLPLIVVNCIILGRAEGFANQNTVGMAALDGLGMGLGYTLAMVSIALIREILGFGSVFGIQFIPDKYHILLFSMPAGGFIVVGILMAVWNRIAEKLGKPRAGEGTDACSGCPIAANCQALRSNDLLTEENKAGD